jgi:uncharacterized protein (DUF2237 family)
MNLQESIRRILREEKKKERTHYHQYKLGDVIDGSKLDDLSGGLVGNDNNQYVLIQYPLYKFPYTRQDLIDFDPEYAEEEIWRLESIKDNFDKTPPIPQEGDGLHRIIAAKELGYKTILMWKKITNLQESIKRILREEITEDKNLYGEKLKPCSTKPMTGFYRDGYCRTGDDDTGSHTVCARVTEEFLEFTNSMGNNLDMLEPGDKWCLCAMRWKEANEQGVAPKIIEDATNIKTLDIIDGVEQELDEYARTLKNARRQGVGMRFPKSAVKSNPSRFRKYSREKINESKFFYRRINLDELEKILPINAQQVYYETGSYKGFKYDLTLRAVEAIMWNDYELGWEDLPEQEEIDFVTEVSNIFEDKIKALYNFYNKK